MMLTLTNNLWSAVRSEEMATSVTPTKTPRLLPFVKPPASEAEQWDGWVVTTSGDDAADYLKGREYAREAVEAAKEYGDVAPVAYSLACLYAKAHLVGKSSGAIEKGFIDALVGMAMRASLN
jgi:hypothetical protein